MTDVSRRTALSALTGLMATALAGCASEAPSDSGDASEPETTTATTERTTTDEQTTRDTSHPGVLSIINDTGETREFTVTIVDGETDKERTFDLTVTSGKQREIPNAYPIVADGIVVHETTIESNEEVLSERDVRVFDYHKVHDVTATVTESGVEWSTTVH